MILTDMVDFVCGKVNQTEAEDKASCKGFLTQQHEILWHSQLWKDALVSYTQTLSPSGYTPSSNWLPTKGVLLVPPIIERVLAVRTDSRKLNVRRPEFYYRVDYDAFARTGTPAEYVVLPGCAWEFDASYALYANRASAADGALKVTTDLLDADGAGVTRYPVTMDQAARALATSDRVDALLKLASQGAVTVTPDYITCVNNWAFDSVDFRWADDALGAGAGPIGTSVPTGGSLLLTNRQKAFLTVYEYGFGGAPLAAAAIPLGFYGTVTLDVAAAALTAAAATAPLNLGATDTAAKQRQRIRLVEIPSSTSSSFTIRVLGKRVAPSFSDDLDQPALNGFVQPLLAMGQAEMLERERQYTKAQAKKQESMLLLQELVAVETVQQSYQTQIIPESGYGDDYFGGAERFGFTF